MNLREYNNIIIKSNYRKSLLKVIAVLLPQIILLIPIFNFFYQKVDGGGDLFFSICFTLFVGGAGIFIITNFLYAIFMTKDFDRVINKKSFYIINSICPHCLNNINLFTEDDEEWKCNYCPKSFTGNILRSCPYCGYDQRLFECPICSETIDIDAEYDENKLEKLRYERQTQLLQQKNQSPSEVG